MQHEHGIRANAAQFFLQLLQVLLVGLTLGMLRTVVPALAESEFGVPKGSFLLLASFVVAFGVVKGALNFIAGRLSERIGRREVLRLGWIVALPIPVIVWWAPSWSWIVLATVLLGVNQGLTWSMTQTAKLDLTRADQRGLTLGLNEFSGYVGVAFAGVATGYLAESLGARDGLMIFGLGVVVLALVTTQLWVRETLPWARAEAARHRDGTAVGPVPRYPTGLPAQPGTWDIFALMSWRDRRLAAFSQAGLVEKFVDALVWVLYPAFLYQRGMDLPSIGWIVGMYGFVWGGSQLFTGRLSDHVGRYWPNVLGMWICGAGVAMMLIGEGPGYHEDMQGRPFVGASGQYLEELLAGIRLRMPHGHGDAGDIRMVGTLDVMDDYNMWVSQKLGYFKEQNLDVELQGDADQVTPEAKFIEDLGADSLDTVELVMALEEEFECEIPDEEAEKITTVQQAIDYVQANTDA